MKSKLHQLSSESPKTKEVYWNLLDLEHSYHFFIGELPEPEVEIFFEHDELVAYGIAYQGRLPMSMLDVFEKLDAEFPDSIGLKTDGGRIELIRKRLNKPGVLLKIDNQIKDFISDRALRTINFIDFYEEVKQSIEDYDDGKTAYQIAKQR